MTIWEAKMKPKTMLLLVKASQHLMIVMEILNSIDEKEYHHVVKIAREQKKEIRNICFSAELGGLFMVVFRVREWLESIAKE